MYVEHTERIGQVERIERVERALSRAVLFNSVQRTIERVITLASKQLRTAVQPFNVFNAERG